MESDPKVGCNCTIQPLDHEKCEYRTINIIYRDILIQRPKLNEICD